MRPASPFTDMAAVRAWDTWFRWRDASGLRDRTIEATWTRVASAVARAEGVHAEAWSRRYYDAFSRWQLIPDEMLVRTAGTPVLRSHRDVLRATVNAHAFASRRGGIAIDGIVEAASLAVRLLDDARRSVDIPPAACRLCLLGVGQALAVLGLEYDSEAGRDIAAGVAAALGQGVRLGLEETGLRNCRTEIAPQPRLAALANATTDALEPLPGDPVGNDARRRMRLAVQPWIDEPIVEEDAAQAHAPPA